MTTTRAAVLSDGRITTRELQIREPGVAEVKVRIGAAGICASDLHTVDGDWPSEGAVVLGHEAAGIVEAIGPMVHHLAVGDLVSLCWFAPCGHCRGCLRGQPWLCRDTRAVDNTLADGSTPFDQVGDDSPVLPYLGVGAFSEHVVVPATAAVKMPAELPLDVAALIGCATTTGVCAVTNTADVRPGDAAVVIGCGGVGQSVVMGLRLVGAHPIVAVDISDERLAAAEQLGATHVVNSRDPEAMGAALREIASEGFDFAFEAAGRTDTMGHALAHLAPGGAAVIVGMPGVEARTEISTFQLADQGQRILGSNYGSAVPAVDFQMIADQYLAGRLPIDRLIGRSIGLDQVGEAFDDMRASVGARSILRFD